MDWRRTITGGKKNPRFPHLFAQNGNALTKSQRKLSLIISCCNRRQIKLLRNLSLILGIRDPDHPLPPPQPKLSCLSFASDERENGTGPDTESHIQLVYNKWIKITANAFFCVFFHGVRTHLNRHGVNESLEMECWDISINKQAKMGPLKSPQPKLLDWSISLSLVKWLFECGHPFIDKLNRWLWLS